MQKNSKHNKIRVAGIILLASLFVISCERKFTDPPPLGEPGVVANISIKDVKARYTSGAPVAITDDAIIEGVV